MDAITWLNANRQEILLRAKNNFGDWTNEEEARENVEMAIIEMVAEWQDEVLRKFHSREAKLLEKDIVEEMLQDL